MYPNKILIMNQISSKTQWLTVFLRVCFTKEAYSIHTKYFCFSSSVSSFSISKVFLLLVVSSACAIYRERYFIKYTHTNIYISKISIIIHTSSFIRPIPVKSALNSIGMGSVRPNKGNYLLLFLLSFCYNQNLPIIIASTQ